MRNSRSGSDASTVDIALRRRRRTLFAFAGGALFGSGVAAVATRARASESIALAAQEPREDFYSFADSLGLTDQHGGLFDPDRLRGRVVLLNCIFAGCGITCPLVTQIIVEALRGMSPDESDDVRIVSMSLDPLNDSVANLRRFATAHGADSPNWQFLTGRPEAIDRAAHWVGAFEPGAGGKRLNRHTADLCLLDRDGRVLQRFEANAIEPARLRRELRRVQTLRRDTRLAGVPASMCAKDARA